MKTIQAYRFALDLTSRQERDVLAHAGAARLAHNWALAKVKAVMDQRIAERSYGVPDELLTPSLSWSLAGLRKAWNAAKPEVAPWWGEVSKEAFNTGLDALALLHVPGLNPPFDRRLDDLLTLEGRIGDDPALTGRARDCAARLDLAFERRFTGYGDLEPALARA